LPPRLTLLPYTTLFRSADGRAPAEPLAARSARARRRRTAIGPIDLTGRMTDPEKNRSQTTHVPGRLAARPAGDPAQAAPPGAATDRKSTRLNSSHEWIS